MTGNNMKDISEKIDKVIIRLESVKSILELVAEGITDNNQSAALWGCADLLSAHVEKLIHVSEECYKHVEL
jgi:hypothetical protein